MLRLSKILLLPVLVASTSLLAETVIENDWPIVRRRNQERTEPGYIAVPVAANIPGIGFAYGGLGSYFNMFKTESDLFLFGFGGDLTGWGTGIIDMPIYFDNFSLNLINNTFTRGAIEQHRRGIDSYRDDRVVLEFDLFRFNLFQVNYRLFEKRLQIHGGMNWQEGRAKAIYNKDGDKITDTNGDSFKTTNRSVGAILDLTDDRDDPRSGMRFEIQRYDPPAEDQFVPDVYQMDYTISGFIPTSKFSTWAFNLYKSDAVVTRTGETDPEKVKNKLGWKCGAITDPAKKSECIDVETKMMTETINANRYGTSTSLGGTQRMRSYVEGRFYSAHALFCGTEFRWNLTEEFSPFDYFVAKGIRTGIQIAFFYEKGSVSDYEGKLLRRFRTSYGLGFRLLVASGFVVRFDLATGDEGNQPTLIFNYPWSVF